MWLTFRALLVTVFIAIMFTVIYIFSFTGVNELYETCDYTGQILLMNFYSIAPLIIYGYLIYNYLMRVYTLLDDEINAFLKVAWRVIVAAANGAKKSIEENQ